MLYDLHFELWIIAVGIFWCLHCLPKWPDNMKIIFIEKCHMFLFLEYFLANANPLTFMWAVSISFCAAWHAVSQRQSFSNPWIVRIDMSLSNSWFSVLIFPGSDERSHHHDSLQQALFVSGYLMLLVWSQFPLQNWFPVSTHTTL